MKRGEFKRWNEKMFVKYNNRRLYEHPNPLIRFIEGERVRIILRSLGKPGRVVDVGCGEGFILSRIGAQTLVGVDISETAVREASRVKNAVIVCSYAEATPFSDSHFDAAVCSEVLEHTENPALVVKELSRIVRPGGTIVLSVPNEPLINLIKGVVWSLGVFPLLFPGVPRRQDEEWHLHSFDMKVLRGICADTLAIERVYPVPFFLLPVRYVAVCRNLKAGPPAAPDMFNQEMKRKSGYLEALSGGRA